MVGVLSLLFLIDVAEALLMRSSSKLAAPRSVKMKLSHKRLLPEWNPTLSILSLSRRMGATANMPSDPASVSLRERGHAYMGNIAVGSQGQQVTVVFDTGSANLVIPSSSCKDCSTMHFDPSFSQSGSYLDGANHRSDVNNARQQTIQFASGSVSGVAFEDKVCVGDLDDSCADSNFLLVQEESSSMNDFHFDGILGLAPPGKLSMGDGFSLMDSMVVAGKLPASMVAFHFSSGSDDSEVTIGGYDESKAQDVTWLPVVGNGEWKVALDDITVGGTSLNFRSKAVLDSGCGNIAVPRGLGRRIGQALGFQGTPDQCNNIGSFPNLAFVLAGQSFELTPQEYIEFSSKDASHCRLFTRDMPGTTEVVLGHPFLLRYYSIYDQDKLRVGLAN